MVAVTPHILLALAATAMALPADKPTRVEARAPQFSIPDGGLGVGGSSSANDVTSGACKPITYIFARGTTETGNLGTTVGPALQQKLEQALGADKVATQGVNYPADFSGAVQGSISPKTAAGSTNCAQLVKQAVSSCPDTQIVLAGYSQGAQQVHGCLMNLDSSQASKVAAAVTFGDPLRAQPFQNIDSSKTKIFCATGDLVCTNQFIITAAHLSYATASTGPAAEFIQSKLSS
ncbi:putative cutinase [Botryosphaeria dothidea]|uniref:cutinase n=1 Tax=Botryosphaeria dothidea TaxID=55169 RepID=A0A8H4J1R9_9PEZI|nr:putative cutinase [Botryosphaeria dothidea]